MNNRRRVLNNGSFNTSNYLTIEALADGLTVSFTNDLYYGINGEGWELLTAGTTSPSINTGETISFKAKITPNSSSGSGTFTITGSCNLSGNCMSILYGDSAASNTNAPAYAFMSLFKNCSAIRQISSSFLPATTLSSRCYSDMFRNCTSLTTTPALPATTLKDNCYEGMFRNCTSLTTAPILPAKTLAMQCYKYMFKGCGSLKTPPELPATTLKDNCYEEMFQDCTSLTTAPSLSSTTLAGSCYYGMFQGCTSLTTAPILPATTLADSCYSCMFQGCGSLKTPPELPATTLSFYCYSNMFRNCTSLTTAPILPAKTLAMQCYKYMFNRCSNLSYIKAMFTTPPSPSNSSYTYNWLNGVKSSGTFVKNSSATWSLTGASGIPSGWTVQTASS